MVNEKQSKNSLVSLLGKLPSEEEILKLDWTPARELTYIQGIEKQYERLQQAGVDVSKELRDARYNTMEYLLGKLYVELEATFSTEIKEREIEESEDFSPATFRYVANQLADYFEKIVASTGRAVSDCNYLEEQE